MANAVENKTLIDKLAEDVKNLSVHKRKLPAKPPPIYKRSEGNFLNYAQSLNNYFRIMSVDQDERSKLLLTYLGLDDYEAVTRIYPAEKLGGEPYNEAAEKIAGILEENISEAGSMAKLMSCKQNDMSMTKFLKKLENYAHKAFPEEKLKDARQKCLMSAIQANCRSKVLAYEIYNFIKEKEPNYNEVALKCIELEAILGHDRENYDANFEEKEKEISILQINENPVSQPNNDKTTRRCHICNSDDHLKAACPRTNRSPTYNTSYRNNFNGNKNRWPTRNFYNGATYNNNFKRNNYHSNSYPPYSYNKTNSTNFVKQNSFGNQRPYFNKQNFRPFYQRPFSGPRNPAPQRRNWAQNKPVYTVQSQRSPFSYNKNFRRNDKNSRDYNRNGNTFNNRRPINLINSNQDANESKSNIDEKCENQTTDFFKWDQ